jgi:hypothetical protein
MEKIKQILNSINLTINEKYKFMNSSFWSNKKLW